MYRPHLVPLPFPLLGLCLKGVPLLLPAGKTVMKSTENLKKIGLKLNDGNLFPGQIPRRFFKSDSECCKRLLWAFTMTWPNFFFWALFLVSNKIIWAILTSLDQTYSAEKKKEPPPPRRSGLGMDAQNMCAKIHYLLKTAWTCRLLYGKHMHLA